MELENKPYVEKRYEGALQNSSNFNANNDGTDDNYSDVSLTRIAQDAKFLSLINCGEGI